jgi:HEAT repeat protein/uncharacterized protein (UPF0147 family)
MNINLTRINKQGLLENNGFNLNAKNNGYFSHPINFKASSLNKDTFTKVHYDKPAAKNNLPAGNLLFNKVKEAFIPAFTSAFNKVSPDQTLRQYRNTLTDKLLNEIINKTTKDMPATISLLGKLQCKEAIPIMLELISQPANEKKYGKEVIEALSNYRNMDAINALIDVLNDANRPAELRGEACHSLSKIGNRRASKPIFEILVNNQEEPSIRAAAALALAAFPSIRNNEALIETLKADDPELRMSAAIALGVADCQEAIPDLLKMLSTSSSDEKPVFIEALGDLKAIDSLPVLLKELNTTNPEVSAAVINVLKKLQVNCSSNLTKIINNPYQNDYYKENAVKALTSLNYKNDEQVILKLLQDPTISTGVKIESLKAIQQFATKDSARTIENLVSVTNHPELKNEGLTTLGIVGDVKSLDILIACLKNEDNGLTGLTTIKSIKKIIDRTRTCPENTLQSLLQELNNDDVNIKKAILDTLGYIDKPTSRETLLDYIQVETDPDLLAISIRSLAILNEQKAVPALLNLLNPEIEYDLKTQIAASLIQMGQINKLNTILADKTTDKDTQKSIISAFIALGQESSIAKEYLKPGLNVSTLHKLGITGKNVEVAVIDQTVDLTHPEFGDRVIIKPLEHGTLVAGNLAGKSTGVAPEAIVHSYDAFNEINIGLSEIIEKVVEEKLAGLNDTKVINLSVGFDAKYYKDPEVLEEVQKCRKAISMAHKAGINVVIAAGNEGLEPRVFKNNIGTLNLLAFNPHAIIVGAVDTNGTPNYPADDYRADYSSYPLSKSWRQLDVMAPGSKIELPYPGGLYRVASGTSFSTPFVSGLIALMHEVNPDISPEQTRDILNKTAMKLNGLADYKQGNGEVTPYKVIYEALKLINTEKAEKFLTDYNNLLAIQAN